MAWTEALARDAMGDTAALRTRWRCVRTWRHVAVGAASDGAPPPYFFERRSSAILLREFHYGLRLRVGTALRPLLATPPFSWAVGSAVEILHRRHYVRLRVPLLVGDVRFTVGALCAGERYGESGPGAPTARRPRCASTPTARASLASPPPSARAASVAPYSSSRRAARRVPLSKRCTLL